MKHVKNVWLRSMTQCIHETCNLSSSRGTPTIMYEENIVCIVQLKKRYMKGDRTKHILPKLFFTNELDKCGDINVQQIFLKSNLTSLFTKTLPHTKFEGLRQIKDSKEIHI